MRPPLPTSSLPKGWGFGLTSIPLSSPQIVFFSFTLDAFLVLGQLCPVVLLKKSDYGTFTPNNPNYAALCSRKKQPHYAEMVASILDTTRI